jgi:hypothetical protein
MPTNSSLGIVLGLAAIPLSLTALLHHRRVRLTQPNRKRRWRFFPNRAAAGNALLALQILVHPQIAHVLEEKLDDHAEEDDSSGDEDPVAHLHRQAARIRRGDPPDRLTTRLPRQKQ